MGGIFEQILPRWGAFFKSKVPVEVKRWQGLANSFATFPEAPRILILKPDHLGDFVTALEALTKIRTAWPKASITLVCGPWNTGFAQATGLFDHIVAFEFFPVSHQMRESLVPSLEERIARFTRLGLQRFDLAVDLRHDSDSRALLLHVAATYKAAFSAEEGREGLDLIFPEVESAARSSKRFFPFHAATRLTLLADAVIATFKGPESAKVIAALPATSERLPFQPGEDYVVISSASGSALRRWPIARWGELARRLTAAGFKVLFVGGEHERPQLDQLMSELPEHATANLAGELPFVKLAPVLAGAALFVGNDTGVTHLAAYLGVPTLAIYSGVNDPNVWTPRGKRVWVLRASASCSPCYHHELKECTRFIPCISEITVSQVFASAQELLGRSEGSAAG